MRCLSGIVLSSLGCLQIKSSVGMKMMLKTLQEALFLRVRSKLRWSEDKHELGLYCGLILRCVWVRVWVCGVVWGREAFPVG
jgi:hypothetical protein